MTYYEGIDYFVKRVDFPNMASAGVAASNGDGTYTIFINSLFCEDSQLEALEHEVRHLAENHFYREEDIRLIEDEAKRKFSVEMLDELFPSLQAAGVWMSSTT